MDSLDITTAAGAEHLVDASEEATAAIEFKFYPIMPITVKSLSILMKDDFNGTVEVHLSNGDTVSYSCIEKLGSNGPDYGITVNLLAYGARSAVKIAGDDFLEKYAGGGVWVTSIMNCYTNYMLSKNKS